MDILTRQFNLDIPNSGVKFVASSGYGTISNAVLLSFGFTLNFSFKCDDWTAAGSGIWYISNSKAYTEGLFFTIESYPSAGYGYVRVHYYDQGHLASNIYRQFTLTNGHTYTASLILREGWADGTTGKLNGNIYIDNVGGVFYNSNATSLTFTPSSTFRVGMNTAQATATASTIPLTVSRMVIANFDMAATGAPYSVADYYNGKDIPSALLTATSGNRCLLALQNKLTSTVWTGESANAYNMTLNGTNTIVDI